jgi:hypothetical protein
MSSLHALEKNKACGPEVDGGGVTSLLRVLSRLQGPAMHAAVCRQLAQEEEQNVPVATVVPARSPPAASGIPLLVKVHPKSAQ